MPQSGRTTGLLRLVTWASLHLTQELTFEKTWYCTIDIKQWTHGKKNCTINWKIGNCRKRNCCKTVWRDVELNKMPSIIRTLRACAICRKCSDRSISFFGYLIFWITRLLIRNLGRNVGVVHVYVYFVPLLFTSTITLLSIPRPRVCSPGDTLRLLCKHIILWNIKHFNWRAPQNIRFTSTVPDALRYRSALAYGTKAGSRSRPQMYSPANLHAVYSIQTVKLAHVCYVSSRRPYLSGFLLLVWFFFRSYFFGECGPL